MKILFIILVCAAVAGILYLLAIMPRIIKKPDKTPFIGVLYAHRGLHDNQTDAPENSMPAFRKAVEAGYGIELDVQLSKDKIPVIFHDFTLNRVCGVDGKVAEYTYDELRQFKLCQSEEGIPKLSDFLQMVGGRVPLIIEYKIAGGNTQVCEEAERLLSNYTGIYCIESFNPMGVLWYRRYRKEVLRGQLSDSFVREGQTGYPFLLFEALHNLLFNFLTKPDFIAYNHIYHKDWSRCLCRYLYKGIAVAWTIRSQEELDSRRKDFDMFIFDSFVPQEKGKL